MTNRKCNHKNTTIVRAHLLENAGPFVAGEPLAIQQCDDCGMTLPGLAVEGDTDLWALPELDQDALDRGMRRNMTKIFADNAADTQRVAGFVKTTKQPKKAGSYGK